MSKVEVKRVATVDGPSVGVLVFLVFLVLKLTGAVGWSWWWVTLPLWGGAAFLVVCVVVFMAIMIGIWVYESRGNP